MPDRENVNQETGSPPPSDAPNSAQALDLDPQYAQDSDNEKAMSILANAMPWVISMLFHIGLFLVMFFLVFMVIKEQQSEDIIVPDAVMSENIGGMMNPRQSEAKTPTKSPSSHRKQFKRTTKMTIDASKTRRVLRILSPDGATGSSDSDLRMRTNTEGIKSSFFGTGGNAHNIVYVIDRSGSMSDTFDLVQQEILRSIGRLKAKQTFHIIFFSTGKNPLEKTPRRLMPATLANKRKAALFVKGVVTQSYDGKSVGALISTDPTLALERAISVLHGAKKSGKLIYLLTDGAFSDEMKVIRKIRRMTKNKGVLINTFLFSMKVQRVMDMLTKIAKENGGRFKFVSFDE